MNKSTIALTATAAVLAAGLCCTTGLLIKNGTDARNISEAESSSISEAESSNISEAEITKITESEVKPDGTESTQPAKTGADGSTALTPKPLTAKAVDENPYMASGDANIHHDCYNTDSSDDVFPIGIYPEVNVSYEKQNANASPAVFFDTYRFSAA